MNPGSRSRESRARSTPEPLRSALWWCPGTLSVTSSINSGIIGLQCSLWRWPKVLSCDALDHSSMCCDIMVMWQRTLWCNAEFFVLLVCTGPKLFMLSHNRSNSSQSDQRCPLAEALFLCRSSQIINTLTVSFIIYLLVEIISF